MSEEKTLTCLKDRVDIQNTILSYATAADFRDWGLLRTILADFVDIDFTSSGGPALKVTAEAYVAQVQGLIAGFDTTQHQLTNFSIEIKGNQAKTTVYIFIAVKRKYWTEPWGAIITTNCNVFKEFGRFPL
ncbi:MAG: nuclear transport factor 2 family protein [Eubacteriales bacterium]